MQTSQIFILSYLSRSLEIIGSRDGSSDSVKHKEADYFYGSVLQPLGLAFSSPCSLATLGCKMRVVVSGFEFMFTARKSGEGKL